MTGMSPELLDSIQQSPFTPWVGGFLLIFLFFSLIKFIAKTTGKLVLLAIVVGVAALGWNWWGEPTERSLTDVREDWFQSIKSTDLSSKSLQALASDTSRLLKEASALGQEKGRQATEEALSKMAETLHQKMKEAGSNGEREAESHFKKLYDEVTAKLGR